ncbi:uridine kinase [Jatrophihabitans telluris]|uniref:Uridine kinase n=1 Tax=Jatrophihabitans telluris TaxID=2038343 RepID=A0ABY4QW79_9ACTN|nr:uridine kinase [Jatrophihabitans telluris]UQX87234.1 uridine kinase [Jatrophihabitans telluris]
MLWTDVVTDRLLALPPTCGTVRVLAIDGGAAAGKSTLAADIARTLADSVVVHTDDLLDGWDDQFGFWDRLRTQVLDPLAQGRTADVPQYDWHRQTFADPRPLPVPRVLIVEGVSAIQACGGRLTLGVLLQVDRLDRQRRWSDRDGALGPAELRWLDREQDYFAAPIDTSAPVLALRG